MSFFSHKYAFFLNSEDRYDQEIPFIKNQSFGGTMVLWKKELDTHISVHSVSTTSFLPVIFSPPGSPVSVHIALYLPTSGQESEFLEQITLLRITIEELKDTYPECLIYLRGDGNVNKNNKVRFKIFQTFIHNFDLVNIPINHKTYHHFIGDGLFDSDIDVIIQSRVAPNIEKIEDILCRNKYPEVDSHHDAIVSTVSMPVKPVPSAQDVLVSAPRVANKQEKIAWSVDNIPEYQALVSPRLIKLRSDWFLPNSTDSVSITLKYY